MAYFSIRPPVRGLTATISMILVAFLGSTMLYQWGIGSSRQADLTHRRDLRVGSTTVTASTGGASASLVRPNTHLRVLSTRTTSRLIPPSPNLVHSAYDRDQQRALLQQHGTECLNSKQGIKEDGSKNALLQRYDSLVTSEYQDKLFAYCMLYVGHANVYLDIDNMALLQSLEELLLEEQKKDTSVAIQISSEERVLVHEAFLYVAQPHSSIVQQLMSLLLETSNAQLASQTVDYWEASLGQLVEGDKEHWTLWSSHCPVVNVEPPPVSCPLAHGYCCQVVADGTDPGIALPLLALRHPLRPPPRSSEGTFIENKKKKDPNEGFYSTVTERILSTDVPPRAETPNFFDVLMRNDCLPTQKACHKCLKQYNHCNKCYDACPCYCKALCNLHAVPKKITREYIVTPPRFRKDASRNIPKLIHQTWFEPVTPDKYPNMSRLVASWQKSGWGYTFYDDDTAAEFLSEHFPPQVRQAYDAILPGAFKADLFRYCVLLIKGGIYADMDVLLESNLDVAIDKDVGFMTPMDEPGIHVGARSCLWNGLLAVAPGHPFLAQTIELVVNNIRNRFTSVDYDDMLCPNPQLSVSHSVDTLFTCGPCILGAGINTVLRRHKQTEFQVGDIDVWATNEESEWEQDVVARETSEDDPIWRQDVRHLIPGRSVILQQNKQDMGAHRFTLVEQNLMVAATDMPDYDDRPKSVEHYSKTHEKAGVYGLKKLYANQERANEYIRIIVKPASAEAATVTQSIM